MNLPSKQRGMGWFGLMITVGAIGFVALVAMKCWPLVLNEMKLARAVKAVAQDSAVAGSEGGEKVRGALQKWWNVEDIEFLEPGDVKVKNTPGGRVLAYDYWAQVNLISNIYVSFHFTKEEPLAASGY